MRHTEGVLTPTVFHILLALRGEELHGYDIIKRVEADTNGRLRLLTGTLYGAVKRLLAEGLIIEASHDARRRYYKLSPQGLAMVDDELARYRLALTAADRHTSLMHFTHA